MKIIAAPVQCRSVLFDATALVPADSVHPYVVYNRPQRYVVPATIQRVLDRDVVLLVAFDDRGELLTSGGGLPAAAFGEIAPGVPALGRWCYQAHSTETITVGADERERAPEGAYVPSQMPPKRRDVLQGFGDEETFNPFAPPDAA